MDILEGEQVKIEVGRYTINSDKWNWWIEEKYEVEKGKNKGSIATKRVTGYCRTFERCLQTFRERGIGDSDTNTLEEVLELLRSLFEDMDTLDRAKFEEDMKAIKALSR